MKIGDKVALFSHDGFHRFEFISESGVPSGFGKGSCCKTSSGALFYMRSELNTGRMYNVGNQAFWIIGAVAYDWNPRPL